jgi:hypothetical protein
VAGFGEEGVERVLVRLGVRRSCVAGDVGREAVSHPHPDKLHVRRVYRAYLVNIKRKWGSACGLIHYRDYVEAYLWSKKP